MTTLKYQLSSPVTAAAKSGGSESRFCWFSESSGCSVVSCNHSVAEQTHVEADLRLEAVWNKWRDYRSTDGICSAKTGGTRPLITTFTLRKNCFPWWNSCCVAVCEGFSLCFCTCLTSFLLFIYKYSSTDLCHSRHFDWSGRRSTGIHVGPVPLIHWCLRSQTGQITAVTRH